MNLETALSEFTQAKEADGIRPKSIVWYRALLTHMVRFFDNADLEHISPMMLRGYIVSLRRRDQRYTSANARRPVQDGGLSESTIAAHVRALHTFWSWCTVEYHLTMNPMQNIKRPPRVNPDPKGISMDDVRKLFDAAEVGRAAKRDRAILAFLLDTGCRAQSIINLTPDKLMLEQAQAIVAEKGRKARALFLSDITVHLLQEWMDERPASATRVFCTLGRVNSGTPLTYSGLREILRRLKERAEVVGRTNAHSFRHGFAREYIKSGGDLATLSRLMGHSDSLVTVWYYAVFTKSELEEVHRKHSPLRQLKLVSWEDES